MGKSRGPARDAATIFDENAALLVVRDTGDGHALVEALRAHQWSDALYSGRDRFMRNAQLWLFGHAAMEKLVAPRQAITVHTRIVWAGDAYFELPFDALRSWLDAEVSGQLERDGLSTAAFTPLPVLGVPGWWEPQDEAFYSDTTVFRPKRRIE